MTKKKFLAVALVAILAITAAVGASLAYLKDTKTVTNTFTIGQFDAKFILKYEGELAPGADTTAMFNNVTIPAGIDNVNADSFDRVTVVAQAIQANGFDSWEAAFAAFDA